VLKFGTIIDWLNTWGVPVQWQIDLEVLNDWSWAT